MFLQGHTTVFFPAPFECIIHHLEKFQALALSHPGPERTSSGLQSFNSLRMGCRSASCVAALHAERPKVEGFTVHAPP